MGGEMRSVERPGSPDAANSSDKLLQQELMAQDGAPATPEQRRVGDRILRRITQHVEGRADDAIVFVNGFQRYQYQRSIAELSVLANTSVKDRSQIPGKGRGIAPIYELTKIAAREHRDQKVAVDMPFLVQQMLFEPEEINDGPFATSTLSKRDPGKAKSTLFEWLDKVPGGDPEARSPAARLAGAFKRLKGFINTNKLHERPVSFALPMDNPLALAFLAYAKTGELSRHSIELVSQQIAPDSTSVGFVTIEHDSISARIDEHRSTSRPFRIQDADDIKKKRPDLAGEPARDDRQAA